MKLVNNFWKSWSWMVASVGVVLPEILSLVAEHSALIPGLPPEYKDTARLICLMLVVVLRPIKQANLDADQKG